MTDWELVESELFGHPLILRAYLLIRARVNRHEVSRKGFLYPPGTWTTCYQALADALVWIEGRTVHQPTTEQARHAVKTLAKAGLIEEEPLPRRREHTPQGLVSTHPGIRIELVDSAGYEMEKTPGRTPQEADSVTTTRLGTLGIQRGDKGPPPSPARFLVSSPKSFQGSGHAGAPARPTAPPNRPKPPDQDEIEAMSARLGMSSRALRWMSRTGWADMFQKLRRDDWVMREIFDQELKDEIETLARRGRPGWPPGGGELGGDDEAKVRSV